MLSVIPWLVALIKNATRFVVMARSRRERPRDVELIFELFTALYDAKIEWIATNI
jgi:hypothetical protein